MFITCDKQEAQLMLTNPRDTFRDTLRDIHLPHIPDRREGENRAVRIVDDIMCQY